MNVELLLVVVSQRSTNYGATAYVYGLRLAWLLGMPSVLQAASLD